MGCLVTSIENSKEWKEIVERKSHALSLDHNLDLRYFPANPKDIESLRPYIQSINNGSPWDVILIDGIPETGVECVFEGKEMLSLMG